MCIHTHPGRLSIARYLHGWNGAGAKQRSALETSRPELSEDVSFGMGTLLIVEESSLESQPTGGGDDIHRRAR